MPNIFQPIPNASTSAAGIIGLATTGEISAGTDYTKAVTPSGLASILGTAARLDVGTSAGNIPVLDSNGDLVGPIIGRMILNSDMATVPALGEQCTLVDSLTAPTIVQYRLGDGTTPQGISPTSTSESPTINISTDEAKLALTPRAGQYVRVTSEGNRIERFIGGDASNNNNWLVIRNTVRLLVYALAAEGGGSGCIINGVALVDDTEVDCGWVNPNDFPAVFYGWSWFSIKSYISSQGYNLGPMVAATDFGFVAATPRYQMSVLTNTSGNLVSGLPFPVQPRSRYTRIDGAAYSNV